MEVSPAVGKGSDAPHEAVSCPFSGLSTIESLLWLESSGWRLLDVVPVRDPDRNAGNIWTLLLRFRFLCLRFDVIRVHGTSCEIAKDTSRSIEEGSRMEQLT